jgi:hypothetical protein
MPPAMS